MTRKRKPYKPELEKVQGGYVIKNPPNHKNIPRQPFDDEPTDPGPNGHSRDILTEYVLGLS